MNRSEAATEPSLQLKHSYCRYCIVLISVSITFSIDILHVVYLLLHTSILAFRPSSGILHSLLS
jgi:hypothetical protein